MTEQDNQHIKQDFNETEKNYDIICISLEKYNRKFRVSLILKSNFFFHQIFKLIFNSVMNSICKNIFHSKTKFFRNIKNTLRNIKNTLYIDKLIKT